MQLIQSGEWEHHPHLRKYRAEWLGELLVERAEWTEPDEVQWRAGQQINGEGYIWFRFWLPDPRQVVEKYFDHHAQPIGLYLPVSEEIEASEDVYSTRHLLLGLWLSPEGHLTVIGESTFDEAVASGQISPSQAEWAESRIRELTMNIHQERVPPALIRNFAIETRNS